MGQGTGCECICYNGRHTKNFKLLPLSGLCYCADCGSVYEDKVAGLIPEKVCAGLLGEYQEGKDNLTTEYEELSKRTDAEDQDERDVDEYIRRMKTYAGAEVLTREIALTLIGYVKVDAHPGKHKAPRTIEFFYKLIDKPLTNKHNALE